MIMTHNVFYFILINEFLIEFQSVEYQTENSCWHKVQKTLWTDCYYLITSVEHVPEWLLIIYQ